MTKRGEKCTTFLQTELNIDSKKVLKKAHAKREKEGA
jgi:hypothetical protein